MKASIIIVFLALLIAAVFVSDGVVQKKGVKTNPLQITSTEGANEQDQAGESDVSGGSLIYREEIGWDTRQAEESPGTVYSDYYVGDSLVQPQLKTRGYGDQGQHGTTPQYEGEALPDPLLHQDTTPTYTDQSRTQLEFVSELAPSTIVYVGGTTIPLSSYQTTFGKYLWIESNGLRQYMSIPQYSSLPLMAHTSTGGPGEILEIFPSASGQGMYQKTYYNFNIRAIIGFFIVVTLLEGIICCFQWGSVKQCSRH